MSRLDSSSGKHCENSLTSRLHDEGWLFTACLISLVLISGIYGLYRVGRQEETIREMRSELNRVDTMLRDRTVFFRELEANWDKAWKAHAEDMKFIREHVAREESHGRPR